MDAEAVLARPPDRLDVDALVIGTGPGGAVTAALLAEHGRGVIAIEDGPLLSQTSCAPFSQAETEQKYRSGGLTVTLGTPIVYAEGRCVGGGSEINSGLYHRTPAEELDRWAVRHGLVAAGEDDMEPHFAAIEEAVGLSAPPAVLPGPSARLAAGAAALGWSSLEVPRLADADPPDGAAARPGEGRHSGRHSMTRTLLPRALRAGARLVPGARAHRLRRESGRWRAVVRHEPPGAPARRIDVVAREVWVAAGAIHTPLLLARSGMRGRVGRSLRLQTMARVVARFPDAVNDPLRVSAHQVKEFAPRSTLGCSVSTLPHLAMALLDHGPEVDAVREAWPHMALFYAVVRSGTGRVRTLPGVADPLVTYRLGAAGLEELATGMRRLARLLLHAGADTIFPCIPGAHPIREEGAIASMPATLARTGAPLTSLHLVGSCPMGASARGSAADSFGRVLGADALHVADASMLCDAPGVNPQGTIMAFARRNVLAALGAS
jgi:choline dehydrogenase-like flavoprotein